VKPPCRLPAVWRRLYLSTILTLGEVMAIMTLVLIVLNEIIIAEELRE